MGFANTPYMPHTPENGLVDLYLEFTTSTSGTIVSFQRGVGKGFAAVPATRLGAGNYSLNLSDSWQGCLAVTANVVSVAAQSGSEGAAIRINSRTLTGATPNVQISFIAANGTGFSDVINGGVVLIHMVMKASTV